MSATFSAPVVTPPPRPGAPREEVLRAVLNPGVLPTPPAVALQVVDAASRPDCDPRQIVSALGRDPALCAKLLRAVNSCLYGLKQPVASVARAVQVLGLGTVRSLALGLSLPSVKSGRVSDKAVRDYWVSSVGGAIMARELAPRLRRPCPDDELVAGLLRDLGALLLHHAFGPRWTAHLARAAERADDDPCPAEAAEFGVDHADVTAELLRDWNLPHDLVEPIRFHHRPDRLAGPREWRDRAELLWFADQLVGIDAVTQRPAALERLLSVARDRFGMALPDLIAFLQSVAPKVGEFATLLNQDIGQCPDFAATLAAGAAELVNLTVESSRNRISSTIQVSATMRPAPAAPARSHAAAVADAAPEAGGPDLPPFEPGFVRRLPPGGCRLGEYELRSLLGSGAMGVVFKAFEPSLRRHVAVKVLAPELATSAAARQRFAREARAAAAIQHENVVAVYAVREDAGVGYMAMEYVDGSCLEAVVERSGPMPAGELVAAARQVAAGLAAAHARGIVHRDIKPANILVEVGTGRVKLTDFGLARVADDAALTAEGSLVGTPFYMAPEVVQGEAASPASDLFSLGGVLYTLATGRAPFGGATLAAVLNAVASREPVPPLQLRPDLPPRLAAVIHRLLKKDPADRFPTAAAVASALADGC